MKRSYLLGIDIGTQGTKTVLFDDRGRHRAAAFRKSRLRQATTGVVEEDPEYQFNSVCHGIKSCISESGIAAAQVAAIGIDGQMAGILGIGKDGHHVTPYDSWLDTRCARYITIMNREAGEEIICKTGGPASFNHGPKILWWKHEHPDVYARIAAFVQPGAYCAMRLCGLGAAEAFIDKSYLHFSGFADNPHACWDESLCRQFDVAAAKLPRIVNPHEVIGQVTAQAARRCGVTAGIPVIAGCGDTAASFLACGATREGVCVDVAGTASVFAATTRQFKADTEHGVLGWGQSATPGLWHPYAYINGGGMNLEWFVQEFEAQKKKTTISALDQLNRRAAQLPLQLDDPVFVPHLGGRVNPSQPNLRGSWAGVTWSHSAAHLYRSMLEGVALEYCIYRDVLRSLNPELKMREIRITGGGEKSGLWNQMKADTLGIRVVQIQRPEGAPLGVALLAGFGVGLYRNISTAAKEWVKIGKTVLPDRKLAKHFQHRLAQYKRLLDLLNQWGETDPERT